MIDTLIDSLEKAQRFNLYKHYNDYIVGMPYDNLESMILKIQEQGIITMLKSLNNRVLIEGNTCVVTIDLEDAYEYAQRLSHRADYIDNTLPF